MNTIIFDVDGTLIDSMAIDTELYFCAVREILGAVKIRDLHDYEHVTDSGILQQIYADNGHPNRSDVTDRIKAVFVDSLGEHVQKTGPFPAIDGAVRFLEKVRKARGTQIGIATGGWRESACIKLKSAGFDIDGIPMATGNDSPARAEIMRLALTKIGSSDESVTYFGDAEWDRQACQSLGWRFVAVGRSLSGIESYAELEGDDWARSVG